jgi:hypothetical protein
MRRGTRNEIPQESQPRFNATPPFFSGHQLRFTALDAEN